MRVERTITLSGPDGYGRKMPPDRLGPLFDRIGPTIQRCIRMRFLGRSSAPGRRPDWLNSAGDIRFVDYSGNGNTVLHFEAPTFGEAMPELYEQGELWHSRPAIEATGFDLLGEVIGDIQARNADSGAFDSPLLRQIARFEKVFDEHLDQLVLGQLATTPSVEPVLTHVVTQTAKQFQAATPNARRVRVTGVLDMLWSSRQAFSLTLSGEPAEVSGVLLEGDIADLKDLFRKRVLVEGQAVYRPSGRVLRLDAERVLPAEDMQGSWDSIPPPMNRRAESIHGWPRQTPQTGINAVIGKWPSDETDDEIFEILEQIS